MVGHLPAEFSIAGQSAIAISLILLWAVGGLIASMGVGTQALAARRYGEGETLAAGEVLNNAALFAGTLAVLASIGFIFALPDLFPWLHSNPSVVRFGVDYCTYRFAAVTGMVLTIVYKGFFDGIGQTKVHMTAALVMNGANIILNYLLIFGIGPFPQMNVAGAGLASLIATYIGLAIMLYWSARSEIRKRFGLYAPGSLSLGVTWSAIRIGIPGGLATLFVMTGFAVFISIVGRLDQSHLEAMVYQLPSYKGLGLSAFGVDAAGVWTASLNAQVLDANPPIFTAATKVIMDVMSVVFMTCMAFGQATATLVGQSLGANDPDLAERYGWESVKIGAYIMSCIGAIIFLFPDAISGGFNPDHKVVDAAHDALQLMALSAAPIALGMILAQSLFGAGVTVFVAVAEAGLHFFCLIPLAWLFGVHFDGGMVGIWSAALSYILGLAAVMTWKFRQGSWKENRI
jgi:MATE family multidrug resistance protein